MLAIIRQIIADVKQSITQFQIQRTFTHKVHLRQTEAQNLRGHREI